MSSLLDICWMAVEPKYAPEVQALVQSLRARDGGEGAEGSEVAPEPNIDGVRSGGGRRRNNNGGVVWDADEYDAFMAADKESYRRVRAFADVSAASPEEPFTTTRVSEDAGVTPTQLRAALGKFTTWMSVSIDDEQWPFGWAYGEDVDPENSGGFHYRTNAEQGEAWRAARERYRGSE